jgi:nitric oxide reductase activation protein
MEETNQDWEGRFEKATKMRLAENYDGVVMERLQQKFTNRNAQKYIINLSDGSPAGPGYHGRAADAHTKHEIDNARKRGIGVFAISVVRHVVEANNRIYGHSFNIDGSKNTAAQFRTLIGKLVS